MIVGLGASRQVSLFFCILFYSFIGLAGGVWIHFTGRKSLVTLLSPNDIALTVLLAVGCTVAIAILNKIALALIPAARSLEEEFGFVLGKQPKLDCFIIAVVSGFAEEVFFRGAMLQNIGLAFTTIIFALVHWPLSPKMLLWPVYALVAGLILGIQTQLTNSIIAPIITHTFINFVNLMAISAKYGKYEQSA